ncbi:unnamed protein product [Sphagnum compactum]
MSSISSTIMAFLHITQIMMCFSPILYIFLLSPAKEPIVLSLKGKPGLGDVYSSNPKVMPTFHSFSPSVNVNAEVVYANYGRLEDFQKLGKLGINVKDVIVIARKDITLRPSLSDPQTTLPTIPSLPISAEDALPILASLSGPVSPAEWHGALDLPHYRVGRGPRALNFSFSVKLFSCIATFVQCV